MGLKTDDETFDGHRIMAIQDMNNDKFVDLITLNEAADTVTVHYFDEYTGKYTH